MLTATLLTVLPSSYIGLNRAHGFNQDPNIPTTSLPFGPQSSGILFKYYSDFQTMFNAFTTGGPDGLDSTDWPMFAADSGINVQTGSFCDSVAHPDWYCGATNINFGLFQVDMNHDRSFLGVAQLQPRTTSAVSVALTPATSVCGTGLGSVTVTLQNQETNAVDQLFAANNMTLTQVLAGGVLSGSTTLGNSKTGTYAFPCVVSGLYLLSTSDYANCASTNLAPCEVNLGSATSSTATFHSNWNSPSTQKYTQNGIYVRQAVRHLLDKNQFILGQTLLGQAQCTDIYAARPQGFTAGFCSGAPGVPRVPLPADVLKAECPSIASSEASQAIPAAQQLSCNPVDAYTLNETALGQTQVWWGQTGPLSDNGYPSRQDVQAACDLLHLAGFAVVPSGATCFDVGNAAQGPEPIVGGVKQNYAHLALPADGSQIIFYDRTHPPRRAFGQITIDGLNFIFGTANNGAHNGGSNPAGAATCAINHGFKSPAPGCTPAYYRFTEISDIIFADGLNAQTWNLYTGGESFGINPDNEYSTFNSAFASNYCGGLQAHVISDYDIACDPKLDAYTAAGEFGDTFNHAVALFQNATYVSTEAVSANPVYNLLQRFVALNSANFGNTATSEGSLVNGQGTGWQAGTAGDFSTLLNAHCNTAYVPASAAFACGASGIHRHGQSQDSDSFSPYQATSVWDFDVMDMIWDSMLLLNPDTGGPTLQLSNFMVVKHTSSFSASEISNSPGLGSVAGTTTQEWYLRPDVTFHDGTLVTADDICFSILTDRDMPSALIQPSVINVATCRAVNTSQVEVKLGLSGPFYDDQIGGVLILPHHVWAAACNWPVGIPEPAIATLQASNCANANFDPMLGGLMIGSSAFECIGLPGSANPGAAGGSCAQTAAGAISGQSNTLGGRLLLTAYPNYMRGPVANQGSKYQKFSWADKFGDGVVGIGDLSDAAIHNRHYDPYWASPLFSSSPATCSATGGPGTGSLQCVDIGDLGTIALYQHIGAWSPIVPAAGTADPHLNRFNGGVAAPTGSVYLGGTQSGNVLNAAVFNGASTTVTSVTAVDANGQTATCTSGLVAPDGPGRTTWTCTFGTTPVHPITVTVTFSNGDIVKIIVP